MKRQVSLNQQFLLIILLILTLVEGLNGRDAMAQAGIVWSEPRQISDSNFTVQATTVAADSAGNVHMMWSEALLDDASITGDTLFYTRWDGDIWTKPTDVLVSPGGEGAIWPELAITPDGWLHAIWTTGGIGTSNIYYARSHACCADQVSSWSEPRLLAGPVLDTAALIADDAGNLHIAYAPVKQGNIVRYMRSNDGGETWVEDTIFADVALSSDEFVMNPRLAVDGRQRVHLVWSVLPWPGQTIGYTRSENGGATWSPPTTIDSHFREDYVEGYGPISIDIIAQGDDTLHLTWDGAPTIERNHVYSTDGGLNWSAPRIAIPEVSQTGRAGWNPMVVDDAGLLHIVSMSVRYVWHAQWDGDFWSRSVDIGGGLDFGPHYMHMVNNLGNELHVTWVNKATDPHSAWHVVGRTESPRRDPFPIPEPTLTSTPVVTHTLVGNDMDEQNEAKSTPILPSTQSQPPTGGIDGTLALILVPSLIIVLVVVFIRLRKVSKM